MRYIFLNVVTFLTIFANSVFANSSDSFTWFNDIDNAQLFQEIKKAFLEELQPDIPDEVKPIMPYFYKYIARIGGYRNSYIVLIGYREHENDPNEYDHFRAFLYDRIKIKKIEIQPKDVYYKFTFVGLATFEPSSVPDVVFKYYDCLECEAVELISSFTFDRKEEKWKIRIWPDNDPHLLIGSDIKYGSDDIWIYDCLYKIADFNRDGFADIAIRCRRMGETTKTTKDEIILYTIQKGVAKKITVRDKKAVQQINAVLCRGQSSPLCK